ncbi:MAG: PP2C family protein-serine/threonine phosphatase [Tepidisphaeraceae bacterium]
MPDPTSISCLEVWGGNEPVDAAVKVPGLDVFVYSVPFENAAAGGDVHFVSSCGSGRIARIMVADVAGHGQQVAEVGRTLRGLIRRHMNHIDQRKLLARMNEAFTEVSEAGVFATAITMTYFSPDRELSLCNAGHPAPLLFRRSDSTWRYLDADGPMPEGVINIPLGILADAGYEQFAVTLERGDLVLCYTDSLVEAICRDGEQLGAERLLEVVRSLSTSDPTHLIHQLIAKLAVFGATLADDVTVLVARCDGSRGGAGFVKKLGAQLKFMGQLLTLRRNLPWPEFTIRNVGGMLIPGLSKRRR